MQQTYHHVSFSNDMTANGNKINARIPDEFDQNANASARDISELYIAKCGPHSSRRIS